MLMLTVTLSHVPDIFTPAPEDRTSFFPTTFISHICTTTTCSSNFTAILSVTWPLLDQILWADTFQDIIMQSCVYFRRQKFEVIMFSTDLKLCIKLRHSSAERDVADKKRNLHGSQGSTTTLPQNLVSFTHSSDTNVLLF